MVYNPYTNPEATDAWDSIDELEYDLREALSEIARHHEDFQKIRDILDDTSSDGWSSYDDINRTKLAKIRNIVG